MVKDWEQGHHSQRGISAVLVNSTASLWKGPSGNEAFGVTGTRSALSREKKESKVTKEKEKLM